MVKKLILFSILSIILVLSILAIVLCSFQARRSHIKLQNSLKQQYKARLIANELRHSSDDLTRFARTFVATGNPKYEKMYWDVLGIREGHHTRPEKYDNIYWDLVVNYGDKPRPDGQKKPLKELIDEIGLTEEEISQLHEAQNNSNDLVRVEMIAMNAVKGLYDSGNGKFTKRGKPDFAYARTLMHDQDYHLKKQKIMKPINSFNVLVDRRFIDEVNKYYRVGYQYTLLISSVSIIGVVILSITFVLIITGLKEQKELNNQLIQSEKLAAIGQLSSGISHEFNNILQIMSGRISVMLKHKKNNIIDYPESVSKSLLVIKDEIIRGKDIVKRILEIAHPQKLQKEQINIENIIDEVVDLQKYQLTLESIELIKNYKSTPEIYIDETLVYQVILNLIINARHAIKPNKKGKIFVNVYPKNNDVVIEVEDTGIGISQENREKIFNPFFTTKGGRSKDRLGIKGTGLGLSVSYRTIKEHNGNILFKSKVNSGTKFIVTFPIQ
jgi:signal transduction histidine kinase